MLANRKDLHPGYLLHELRKHRGFSLVELMVVVSVLGVLMALGLPSFNIWIQNSKTRSATESILSGIQDARAEAVRRNAPVFFELNPEPGVLWQIGCVTVVIAPECPAEIKRFNSTEGSLMVDGQMVVTVTPTGGGSRLIFDSFGRRRLATSTPPNAEDFNQINLSHATLPSDDNRTQRIIIGTGGGARMCDPKLVAPNLLACP